MDRRAAGCGRAALHCGCVGSRSFAYQPVEEGDRYLVWVKRPFIQHFTPKQVYVPAPLVRPGGYSRVVDLRVPATPAGWNPARLWDASVQYDQNGATLRGGAWGVQERAAAIQMSIMARQ